MALAEAAIAINVYWSPFTATFCRAIPPALFSPSLPFREQAGWQTAFPKVQRDRPTYSETRVCCVPPRAAGRARVPGQRAQIGRMRRLERDRDALRRVVALG